nr:MAG TPA: Putative tail fiber protein fold, Tail fiber, receptor [Caudoviricetes sp.]
MYAVEQGTVGTSHYVRFSNGLILQWGYALTEQQVTFPIPFSSKESFGLGFSANFQSGWWSCTQTVNLSETGFLPRMISTNTGSPSANKDSYWIAIGN